MIEFMYLSAGPWKPQLSHAFPNRSTVTACQPLGAPISVPLGPSKGSPNFLLKIPTMTSGLLPHSNDASCISLAHLRHSAYSHFRVIDILRDHSAGGYVSTLNGPISL